MSAPGWLKRWWRARRTAYQMKKVWRRQEWWR